MLSFKRNYYNNIVDFITNSTKSILLVNGPRKIGKTVMLKQIEAEFSSKAKYFDFKKEPNKTADYLLELVRKDADGIYLFDEITYCPAVETVLCEVSELLAIRGKLKGKFVFTGSQHIAQEKWFHSNFSCKAKILDIPFLQYDEYLRYIGSENNNADTFRDFVLNSWKFNDIDSNRDYLESCLIETIQVNEHCRDMILRLCDYEAYSPVEDALRILSATIFKLHNKENWTRFFNKKETVIDMKRKIEILKGQEDFNSILLDSYFQGTKLDFDSFRNALRFLLNSKLVIMDFNYEREDKSTIREFYNWLSNGTEIEGVKNTVQFFKRYNLIITNPLFYVNVLGDIIESNNLNIKVSDVLSNDILGSILECYIKGVNAFKNSREYNYTWNVSDDKCHEIDLIIPELHQVVEITVSDKNLKATHFENFDDYEHWNCILLGTRKGIDNYATRIPYWEYVYTLCETSTKPKVDMSIYAMIPEATRHLYGETKEEIVENYLKGTMKEE